MPGGTTPLLKRNGEKEIKLDLKVAISALIVSVAAIIVSIIIAWVSLSSSPEEDLVKLGYHNSPEELWQAVTDRNLKAVTVFAKAGTSLPTRVFTFLFDDAHFDPAILDALIKGGNVRESECPTQIDQLAFYQKVAANPERASRLRRLCGKPSVIAKLSAVRQLEAERLKNDGETNASRPDRLRACRQKYEADQQIFDDAVKMHPLSTDTLTERQCVLSRVNIDFLVGDVRVMRDGGRLLRQHIDECCSTYDQLKDISPTKLQSADAALRLLSAN